MIKRALISVSDKRGIVKFAGELEKLGIEIISTGGTGETLEKAGIKVKAISDVTGFPECLDGRVKTLHPKIHGGILAKRDNPSHLDQLRNLNIDTIDLVVINLYPFRETIEREGTDLDLAIENIDIGGPAMIRAAAKNYKFVTVVTEKNDYGQIIDEIRQQGDVSAKTRFHLACKAFEHTASYDGMIASYLRGNRNDFPDSLTLTFEKYMDMRYGENPHQRAACYRSVPAEDGSILDFSQLNGKELSFNNINDVHGAVDLLREFSKPAVVGVKHANPCGVAQGRDIFEAYRKAYEADPVSIYGGIIAANRTIDGATAGEISRIFAEIIIAPDFTGDALEVLRKKKNLRILKLGGIDRGGQGIYDIKKVAGGILIQEKDSILYNRKDARWVTVHEPGLDLEEDLEFAMKVVKHTKSNGVVIVKDGQTVGIGPGQANRVTSLKLALDYAKEKARGAVIGSDAFFPFADWVEDAHRAGIRAVIQPGGSIRDEDSIKACNDKGIAMLFTGIRHFKH